MRSLATEEAGPDRIGVSNEQEARIIADEAAPIIRATPAPRGILGFIPPHPIIVNGLNRNAAPGFQRTNRLLGYLAQFEGPDDAVELPGQKNSPGVVQMVFVSEGCLRKFMSGAPMRVVEMQVRVPGLERVQSS